MDVLLFSCPLGVWFDDDQVLCHLGIFFLVRRLQEHHPKALVSVLQTWGKLSSTGARNNFLMAIRRRAQMFHHGAVSSHRHCACPRALLSLLKNGFLSSILIFRDILSVEEALLCGQSSPHVPHAMRGLGLSPGTMWGRHQCGRRAEVEEAMEGGVISFVSEPWGQNNLKTTWHSLGRGLPSESTWSSHHDFPFHISSPVHRWVLGRLCLQGNLGCVGWKQINNITEIFW